MTAANFTLYQFELCPFCNKVRAGLDLKGMGYQKVEVNPMSKAEIKHIGPGPSGRKKVPILEHGGGVLHDSTDILARIDELKDEGLKLWPADPEARKFAEEVDEWVDEHLTKILPTVLYATWGSAFKAGQLIAQESNFSALDNLKVKVFSAFIMKMIAKRILKKRGGDKTGEELLSDELDKLESWLGDKDFLCGDTVTVADAAVQGALSCILHFPAFRFIEERPALIAWFGRVEALRQSPST